MLIKENNIQEIAKNANLQESVSVDDLFNNLPEDEEEKIDEIILHLKSASEKDWHSTKKVIIRECSFYYRERSERFWCNF